MPKSQAEIRAERKAARDKELEKRRKQAEAAIEKTTGTISSTVEKIKGRRELLKNI